MSTITNEGYFPEEYNDQFQREFEKFPSNKLQSIIAHSFEDNDTFETL